MTDWKDPIISDRKRVGPKPLPAAVWRDLISRFPGATPIPAGEGAGAQGEKIPFSPRRRGLKADVLLGVRDRESHPERNWPHWQRLADAIRDAGRSFAVIGARPTTHDLHGQSWHTGDLDADATLELMLNLGTLYVGTDSGASHLAAAAGCQMIIFRKSGSHDYVTESMERVNPGRVTRVADGWTEPGNVVAAVLERLPSTAVAIDRSVTPETPVAEIRAILDQPPRRLSHGFPTWPNVHEAYRQGFRRAIGEAREMSLPADLGQGRGVVIAGGGKYFASAYVTIRILRHVGCQLPVELWHLGAKEMTDEQRAIVEPLGVKCVDAEHVAEQVGGVRILGGWESKSFAVLHCGFREVLFLDADSYPIRSPESLFESPDYLKTGAVFWPDKPEMDLSAGVWGLVGLPRQQGPGFEVGQFMLDKSRHFRTLWLANWMNQRSDYYYHHFWGDTAPFRFALAALGAPYAMPAKRWSGSLGITMIQHDLAGLPLFNHRNTDKFNLEHDGARPCFASHPQASTRQVFNPALALEREAHGFLDDLAAAMRVPAPQRVTIVSHAPQVGCGGREERAFIWRLDDGAGRPCLFLPNAGEFGMRILTQVRMIHWHRASRKVVCCRPGEEVLFPSADEFVRDWDDPLEDARRGGSGPTSRWPKIEARYPDYNLVQTGGLTTVQERMSVNPELRIPFRPRLRGLKADVVLGIRWRRFAEEKNWHHWQSVSDAIVDAGFTFAVIGRRPTTLDLPGQSHHSSDYADTDAAIELIQNCRLYVGSDTGTSHLAATVGADMLVFREESAVNPDLRDLMSLRNPGRVELMPAGTWRGLTA